MGIHRTRQGTPSQASQVYEFVKANPCCVNTDVQAAFGFTSHVASMYLSRLKQRQLIGGQKIPGTKLWSWMAVGPDELPEFAIRIHRKEWQGHPRDDWHNLFYGSRA